MKRQVVLIAMLFLCQVSWAQHKKLQSGPMLGYAEMKEALLWVQTTQAAKVHFTYWAVDDPKKKYKTATKETVEREGFTARLLANKVQPGTTYKYALHINGRRVKLPYPTQFKTQTLWQYRTDPPPFTMAVGSCAFINDPEFDRPGKPYGGEYEIFESMYKQHPDALLWLGDNTYLREADWSSRTGIIYRYTHTRSLPEMQPLLASVNNFAIWDDHEFGPDNSDRSFALKEDAEEVFQLFWANQKYGLGGPTNDITSRFEYNGIDFWLLDNRSYRSPNYRDTGDRSYLGKQQIEWLIDGLRMSRSPFKVIAVGGQILNDYKKYENYIANHAAERAYLLERIEEENIKGVIFLSGDRHHTEMSVLTNGKGNKLYDLTVSPFTSSTHSGSEANSLRVEGSLINDRNYGILSFGGTRKARTLNIKIYDTFGVLLWEHHLTRDDF